MTAVLLTVVNIFDRIVVNIVVNIVVKVIVKIVFKVVFKIVVKIVVEIVVKNIVKIVVKIVVQIVVKIVVIASSSASIVSVFGIFCLSMYPGEKEEPENIILTYIYHHHDIDQPEEL